MKSLNCSVIGNQQTNSPHKANYCDQVTPEYLPSMAATDISSQQQQLNDFVVEPKLNESVINLDNQTLQECNDIVLKIRGSSAFPARIHKILKHNQMLMLSYLKIFQHKFGLKK